MTSRILCLFYQGGGKNQIISKLIVYNITYKAIWNLLIEYQLPHPRSSFYCNFWLLSRVDMGTYTSYICRLTRNSDINILSQAASA